MTMNTRQAGAFTELIKKEERAREVWLQTHGAAFAKTNKQNGNNNNNNNNANNTQSQANLFSTSNSFGGPNARPLSASGRSASQSQFVPQQQQQQQFQYPGDIYNQAVSVSSARLAEPSTEFISPPTITKKVVRQIEVPAYKQVKVPVRTTQVVEVLVSKQVPTKRLVEYDAMTEREELVEREVVDSCGRRVMVKQPCRLQVPTKKYREVIDYITVSVPEQRAVPVDGVRIDQVQETKLVEAEELQTFALKPVPVGQSQVLATRDLAYTGRRVGERQAGREVYDARDPALRNVESERSAYLPREAETLRRPASANRYANANANNNTTSNMPRGCGNTQSLSASQCFPQQGQGQSRLGFKIRTSTTNPGFCSVYEVDPSASAARAGVRVNDIILSTNGKQTQTLQDFKNAVQLSQGPLLLQIKRGAERFVVTMQR